MLFFQVSNAYQPRSAAAMAGAMLTALLGWAMQSVLQTSLTPAALMTCKASPANRACVTATSTEAAPAAINKRADFTTCDFDN